MKLNPRRYWCIQFSGADDNYHRIHFAGTVEEVLAKADEEECEFEWEPLTINIFVAAEGSP